MVLTWITILDAETRETASDILETKVEMHLLANDEIKAYVATVSPPGRHGVSHLGSRRYPYLGGSRMLLPCCRGVPFVARLASRAF